MDSALTTNTDSSLSILWTFLMGSVPTLRYPNGTTPHIMPAKIMGYAGASLTLILSVVSSFTVGTTLIEKLEANFWSILEDFQDDEDYQIMMRDGEYGPLFENFLVQYGVETVLIVMGLLWHTAFLLVAGLVNAVQLFQKITSLTTASDSSGSDIAVPYGFQVMAFGFFVGSINYLSGLLITNYQQIIFKMTSFYPSAGLYTRKTVAETTVDGDGQGSLTTTYKASYKTRRDFFSLGELREELPIVYLLHHFLGVVCPFLLIVQAEATTVVAITLITIFM